MNSNEQSSGTGRSELNAQALTQRLSSLEPGDHVVFNNRDSPFEVVRTDRYSVSVVDPDGNHHTFSQNLQTGGWDVHETVWWLATVDG